MYVSREVVPCKENDPELWFALPNTRRSNAAKEHCLTCDERTACLVSSLTFERNTGQTQPCVLGGLNEVERRAVLRRSA